MTVLMSSPVTVSVEAPALGPGVTSWRVITPSVSTSGVPFTVATTITRSARSAALAATSSSPWSGDWFASVKLSWKPEREPTLVVTVIPWSASINGAGAGTATTGPMSSVTVTRVIGNTSARLVARRDTSGQGDAQAASGLVGEFLRRERAVRVGDLPELLRVAELVGRDRVESLARAHAELAQQRETLRPGHETAQQVGDGARARALERRDGNGAVPTRGGELVARPHRCVAPSAVAHGIPVRPSAGSAASCSFDARRSLVCWYAR